MSELLLPPRRPTACAASSGPTCPAAPGSVCSAHARPVGGSSRTPTLDLLIDSPVALPLIAMANLRESLTESDLQFSIDLLDRRDASAEFLVRLEVSGMVELRGLAAEHG